MKNFRLLLIFSLLFTSSFFAQPGTVLINHDFEASDDGWVGTNGGSGGCIFNKIPDPFGAGSNCWAQNPFNYYGSFDGAYCASPAIDMSNYVSMTFSIDVRYNTETNWDGMTIYYSTDSWGTYNLLGAQGQGTNWYVSEVDGVNDRFGPITSDPDGWSGDNGGWETATLPVPASLEGNPNVEFRVYFGSDGSVQDVGVAFDNVNITGTFNNPCAGPTGLVASAMTTTEATLTWVEAVPAASDGYQYYYSTSATAPNVLTTASGSVGAGVVTDDISGLTPGMTYYFWVRSGCGSSTYSDWTSGGTFTTTALVPTITSFTPDVGCASLTSFVITGTNLGGATVVSIGGTNVTSFTVDSDTEISAVVGAGSTGTVSVTNPAGVATSGSSFTINGSASITTQPAATLDILGGNSDIITVTSDALAWQWQFSEDDVNWGDIVDGTPANVTYSGSTTASLTISPNTSVIGSVGYYRCVLSCGNIASTSSVVTFVNYCAAGGGPLSGISGVSFGTIDNTGSDNTYVDTYTDYSSSFQATILRNTSYNLRVYVNTNGSYTNYQKAWIDWNANGSFTDAGEEYDLGTVYNDANGLSSSCPLSITVPPDAAEGNIKMRVISRYGSPGTSCLTGLDGEVEDYALWVRFPRIWTGAVDDDWANKDNWTTGELPTLVSLVEIPPAGNLPNITSTVSIEELTIDPGSMVTISSNSLTVSGEIENNSTMMIVDATVNADGNFDGTAGIIDMANANANLILSSTVTDLGDLNAAMGTVTYDGTAQNVLADVYPSLSIVSGGIKTALGDITVGGSLSTAATQACQLDMGVHRLIVSGDITVGGQNGLDLTDLSSSLELNGTADQTITHAGNALAAPAATITEDFETGTTVWSTDNTGTYDVFINSGGTSSSGTGPSAANGGGQYVYFEATGGGSGETNYLTNTFDFSATSSPQISFAYHMYGSNIGSLSLDINTGSGWTSVWSVSGQQQTSNGDTWDSQTVILSAYGGVASCQIRFLAARGGGFTSDVAIDDIVISDNGGFASNYEFLRLVVNNSGGNVILASNIEMDGTLVLTNGDIDASSNNLSLGENATVSGGSDASHVIGTMIKTTTATSAFTFPLGDGTWYKAIGITPNSASSTVWTAQYFNTVYPNTTLDPANFGDIDHVSAYEYWDLDRSGSANAVIALPWVSQNAVSAYADLRLAHFDGTDWDMISATPVGSDASGTVTSGSVVTTYSPFTLASSTSTNTLPIELVSFSGEKKDNRNILNWTTASEINNAYFTIEKSYNGFDFEWVGTQEGTSPSSQIINYSLSDYDVLETLNYYRLKQTDFDGKFEYSKTISIDNRVDNSFKEIIGRTNLLGQDVDEFYNGIVIVRYKDGTSQKFYQFK